MRNPETLGSYRLWLRTSSRKGQLLIVAAIPVLVTAGVLGGRSLAGGGGSWLSLAAGLSSVGAAMIMIGQLRIILHRRRHPWVDPSAA